MKALLAVILALFSAGAVAGTPPEWRAKNVGGKFGFNVTLNQTPCTSTAGALSTLTEEQREAFLDADIEFEGKAYSGCWKEVDGAPAVVIIDETGGSGMLPQHIFAPVTRI